jgi:hypothetical protein
MRDDFTDFDGRAFFYRCRLQVVVRCDDPVAMVNLHAIAATPGMPADCPGDA